MRARIRNVAAVLALALGLSLWALPGVWGVVAFFALGTLAVVLSVPRVSRRREHDAHLPPDARGDRPGLGSDAWEEAQRPPPYQPGPF